MKLRVVFLTIFSCLALSLSAQKYITKTGFIEMFSETPVFTIKGSNNKVASILDPETGEIIASTLIRSFRFQEALVEERFNDEYLEPEKFPKATFQGKITNYKKIDFTKDGFYNIFIEGKLTIHGITNYVKQRGTLEVRDGKVLAKTALEILLSDYQIIIEAAYRNALKDKMLLKIEFDYVLYNR